MPFITIIFLAFLVEKKKITWTTAITLIILMACEININDVKIFGG
jgi:hypothetical protein